ncbi:MAG: mechanosensitive ion channel [Rhabdochlamydiaceae bacterium]|nr:mechanosensitive ion channel [Rhabdochlamydiaceae bacterium]
MDSKYFWWVEGLLGIGALLIIQYGVKIAIKHAEKKNRHGWKTRLGKIFRLPLSVLIWVLGAVYLIDVASEHISFSIAVKYLDAIRKTAVIGTITWIFYRWKKEVELSFLAQKVKRVDSTTVHMVGKLATVAVGVLSGLIILQIFGVNIAPLLAFGSIGAASIGFAGKDVMANFCSGIMLHITRPFIIGDQIYLPEKNLEGHIEEIGWFRTSIRDKEKRPVYLPNNFFSTMLLINISRMSHRRIKQVLKIGFENINKVSEIVEKMKDHLLKTPQIDTHYPVHVFLKSFGEYACEIEIEAYSTITDQEAFNKFQHRVLLELQAILQEADVPLAIPIASWKTVMPEKNAF